MVRRWALWGQHSMMILSVLPALVLSSHRGSVLIPDARGVILGAPAADRSGPKAAAVELGGSVGLEALRAQRPLGWSRSNAGESKGNGQRERQPRGHGGGAAVGSRARAEERARCSKEGCAAHAKLFSEDPDGSRRLLCAEHREAGSDVLRPKSQSCRVEGCRTWPSYGPEGSGSLLALRCRRHAEPGDVNLKAKCCAGEGCVARATYGEAGGRAIFCKLHRMEHHVDTRSRKCAAPGCTKQPSFVTNQGGSGEGVFCKQHRGHAHTIHPNRRCRHGGGCLRARTHGDAEGPQAGVRVFCEEHKLPGQVKVIKVQCEVAGCQRRGTEEDVSGTRRTCSTHAGQIVRSAEEEQSSKAMEPTSRGENCSTAEESKGKGRGRRPPRGRGNASAVGSRRARADERARCSKESCTAFAKYFSEEPDGSRRPLCAEHREAGSAVLRPKSQTCRVEGCRTWPSYGPADSPAALRCSLHAERGHVNLKARPCLEEGCLARATHGEARGRAIVCKLHRMEHHVDKRSRKCAAPGCTKQPSFVSDQDGGEGGVFCKQHRGRAHAVRPNRRCRHEGGCLRARTYGDAAGPQAGVRVFCEEHKLPGQVNVLRVQCEVAGCQRRGTEHDASGTRRMCSRHAGENMGFAEGTCLHPVSCSRKASHGDLESGMAVFCSEHRLSWHVDVSAWFDGLDPAFRDAKVRRGDIVARLYSIPGMWQAGAEEAPEKEDAGEELLEWLHGVASRKRMSVRNELLGGTAMVESP